MSKGGGGSGGGSSTTTSTPPAFLLPYIGSYLTKIFGGGPGQTGPGLANESYGQAGFPNQQVAPFSALENQGLGLTGQEAAQTQGLNTNAINEANATLKGQYLVPPKNVTDALNYQINQEYRNTTAPSEMSAAGQAGAFGGSADAEARGMNQYGLGTAEANTAYGLYEQERQNQIGTAADAAKISLGATIPGQTLLQAGGIQQGQQQNQLNAMYNNLFNQASFPFEQANLAGGSLGTAGGGAGTTRQNASSGDISGAGLLGGGLAGAGIGSLIAPGGWGAGIGGGLGLLLGLL